MLTAALKRTLSRKGLRGDQRMISQKLTSGQRPIRKPQGRSRLGGGAVLPGFEDHIV